MVPATLRAQWQQELNSKFFLPTTILDSTAFDDLREAGHENPLTVGDRIVICSYHFVAAKADAVARTPWDLVVIDEAHRLRNVYRPTSRLARAVVDAVGHAPKLLLTATPLQNSLMELYGLASIVDDHLFGDPESCRDRFVRATAENRRNDGLRALTEDRLKSQLGRVERYLEVARVDPDLLAGQGWLTLESDWQRLFAIRSERRGTQIVGDRNDAIVAMFRQHLRDPKVLGPFWEELRKQLLTELESSQISIVSKVGGPGRMPWTVEFKRLTFGVVEKLTRDYVARLGDTEDASKAMAGIPRDNQMLRELSRPTTDRFPKSDPERMRLATWLYACGMHLNCRRILRGVVEHAVGRASDRAIVALAHVMRADCRIAETEGIFEAYRELELALLRLADEQKFNWLVLSIQNARLLLHLDAVETCEEDQDRFPAKLSSAKLPVAGSTPSAVTYLQIALDAIELRLGSIEEWPSTPVKLLSSIRNNVVYASSRLASRQNSTYLERPHVYRFQEVMARSEALESDELDTLGYFWTKRAALAESVSGKIVDARRAEAYLDRASHELGREGAVFTSEHRTRIANAIGRHRRLLANMLTLAQLEGGASDSASD